MFAFFTDPMVTMVQNALIVDTMGPLIYDTFENFEESHLPEKR